MNKPLNISKRTNVILHALGYIAKTADTNKAMPVSQIASKLNVSEAYLAKVLQPLVKKNILYSIKGAKGGFLINPDILEISLFKLISTIEGEIQQNYCLMGKPICTKKSCIFSKLNKKIKNEIENALENTKLKDFVKIFE